MVCGWTLASLWDMSAIVPAILRRFNSPVCVTAKYYHLYQERISDFVAGKGGGANILVD
jgi:hypothetical protein